MDILVPDSWLREFLKTKATPKQIAEDLSLCGPSIEKIEKVNSDWVYSIEVTTNRVDTASIYGIAREASVILPRFSLKAELQPIKLKKTKFKSKVNYLKAVVDINLCLRFSAVLIKNVKIGESPDWMKERLNGVGVRAINNVVDISNYIMHEMGQPVHTFDYDKIKGRKMVVRASRKGEKITTLDGKTYSLPGGDIVIEDGSGRLIDLAGIMGGENSSVDGQTKNVLLFVQTYNPVNIRKTSMSLAHRTEAAVLFEKALDPELVAPSILRGIELFEEITKGKAEKQVLDLYPNPYKSKKIETNSDFINKILGIEIKKEEVDKILQSLGFGTSWNKSELSELTVTVPSWRANDISIREDLVEEVARIYGYHNLPSELMAGRLPENPPATPFEFEKKIKLTLKGYGGVEVYTLSLISKEDVFSEVALKLKNPLGTDSEYLRMSLAPSLVKAVKDNSHEKSPFHLFEVANVYIPRKNDLPDEVMTLGGVFANSDYRYAKGLVEALLEELHIETTIKAEDSQFYKASQRIVFLVGTEKLGELGTLENGLIYYEFPLDKLQKYHKEVAKFVTLSKYPPQIEDLTLVFPDKTKIGEVLNQIQKVDPLITKVELKDIYKEAFTLRLYYQHPTKTLRDEEVKQIREKVLKTLKEKFGGSLKS